MTNDEVNAAGGPAYPVSIRGVGDNGWSGATMLDYFAAAALTGLMSDPGMRPANIAEFDHMAARLFQVAEAMIRARALQQGRA